jgi:hypothetical protein
MQLLLVLTLLPPLWLLLLALTQFLQQLVPFFTLLPLQYSSSTSSTARSNLRYNSSISSTSRRELQYNSSISSTASSNLQYSSSTSSTASSNLQYYHQGKLLELQA